MRPGFWPTDNGPAAPTRIARTNIADAAETREHSFHRAGIAKRPALGGPF